MPERISPLSSVLPTAGHEAGLSGGQQERGLPAVTSDLGVRVATVIPGCCPCIGVALIH